MVADHMVVNSNGNAGVATCVAPSVAELARIAKDWLTFERLRQELLNQNAQDLLLVHASDRDVEQAVIALFSADRKAEEKERATIALMNALSGHPAIAKLKYDDGHAMAGMSAGALQTMLKARDDIFARWYDFHEGMERVGTTICKIWIGDQFRGTGFLISDRHVLTAYHCVDELILEGQQKPNSDELLKIVFDNVIIPGQQSSAYRAEFRVSSQWLLHHSKQDPNEDTQRIPLDDVKEGLLDFAVICLAEPAGNMAPKWRKSIPRGWIDIDKLATPPNIQAQMLIAHHPSGADLRLCVGLFDKHANKARRVRYQTPTVIGSSGAPCFTVDWRPYALHNAGYPAVPINQGVPLELIRQAIGGSATVLTKKKPEDRIIPAITHTGEVILGRDDIAEKIVAILRGSSTVTTIIITSAPQGGKTFTAELIRSMLLDRGHQAFLFDAEKFATDTPERFSSRLVEECVNRKVQLSQPPSPNSRQRARWITKSLTEWIRNSVLVDTPPTSIGDKRNERTLWVILDRCDAVNFTEETHDLLVALAANEDGNADHALRFVLLGYDKDMASVAPEKVWRTKLDLISVVGILPFMTYTLDTLAITEDSETRKANAANWIAAASNFGIVTIPLIVNGLSKWAQTRRARSRGSSEK